MSGPRDPTEMVDEGPPGGGELPPQRPPIGVDPGYVAAVPQRRAVAGVASEEAPPVGGRIPQRLVPARYFEGDEWIPAQLPGQQVVDLQRRMAAAGLLTGPFRLGVWDAASAGAYRELLAYANATGLNTERALMQWEAGATEQGAAATRAPLTIRQSNPDELRQLFRATAIERLGQGWSQDRINAAVRAYQAVEAQVQQQAYDMETTGGTITDIPSPQGFIEAEIQRQDPQGVQEREMLGFVGQFMQAVGSGAWSA